jgi:hypothetical protein
MLSYFYRLLGFSRSSQRSRHLKTRGASTLSLVLVAAAGLFGFFASSSHGVIVAVMTGIVFWEFIRRLDQGLPLMQVTAVLAVVQWLVGPWLTYNVDFFYSTYGMRVDSVDYFGYALPATAAFVFGLLLVGVSVRQESLLAGLDRSKFLEIGMLLCFLGILGGSLGGLFPKSVAFIFGLVSQLRYVGALYFLFSTCRIKWLLAVLAVVPLFTGAAATGMFHDLLLWMGIIICYWYAAKKRRIWLTLALVTVGSFAAFTTQGIKASYRAKVWKGENASMLDEIRVFWASPELVFSDETLANGIVRINQGWIVAAIMSYTPQYEPYAEGETLTDALVAAFLPRFLFEGKASSGGQVNFSRFTGLPMSEGTSMGMSLLGEAYANLGPNIGVVLMFFMGVGFATSYGLCLIFSVRHPSFYFWIPLIFCQVVKAETDLLTVLNHITKGSVGALGLYWLIGVKLFRFSRVDSATKDSCQSSDPGLLPLAAVVAGRTTKVKS